MREHRAANFLSTQNQNFLEKKQNKKSLLSALYFYILLYNIHGTYPIILFNSFRQEHKIGFIQTLTPKA
jgi:hypothetical protein